MVHLPQTNFFSKIITIILIYLLAPFIVGKLRMCDFWAQNGPFPQIKFLSENLFMSLVSFIQAYLYAKNQS